MVATIRKGESAARRNLRVRLVLERLTNRSLENDYVSRDMERGIALEAIARARYEAETGALVREVGFCAHHELAAGCSPDGVIGDWQGVIEAKCPKPAIHLDYIRSKMIPPEYLPQCRHVCWVTGAPWCDFVSYNADFPPALQLLITRLTMTDAERNGWELQVRIFLRECEEEFQQIQQLMEVAA